jgi:hypothetical protein
VARRALASPTIDIQPRPKVPAPSTAGRAATTIRFVREELERKVGDVFFSDLRAHIARDAVIVVADVLELAVAGEAIATDDVPRVTEWIRTGHLTKPTAEELARWPDLPTARFASLVVAPFVLVHRPVAS